MSRGRMPRNGNRELNRMIGMSDALTELAEILAVLPKSLKADLKSGMSADKLIAKNQELLTARLIAIAATEQDTGKALAALKDLLDRGQGKPTERKTIEHKFSKLKDEELDAYLSTELEDLDDEQD